MDEHTLSVLEFEKIRRLAASFAQSEPGRAAAAALLPAADARAAAERLAETREMADYLAAHGGRLALGQVRDGLADLEHAVTFGRPLEPAELASLAGLVRSAHALANDLARATAFPALVAKAADAAVPLDLADRIEDRIDPRGRLRDWASERLGGLRQQIQSLRDDLRARVHVLLRRAAVARIVQEEQATVRNDRFVLAVKTEYRGRLPGVVHGTSQSGGTVYVEPQELVRAGNELADALDAERREEQRILVEATRMCLAQRDQIACAQTFLAWADLTCAKCAMVTRYGFTVPQMAEDGVLVLHRARHPLMVWYHAGAAQEPPDLEAIRRAVVPFDLELGKDFRILIVTGPNTGGKTVTLKTVGLTAVMAASGLPVCAAQPARVPFYRRVFADVGDEQSLQQNLSTFSAHVKHIVQVVGEAGAQDLVILDELGAGTDPLEGSAIGAVVLQRLRDRGAHVVVSTHLGSLKQYAYTHPEAANAAMEFDPVALGPTYRVLVGIPGQSCALLVAERLGLDPALVHAARASMARPAAQDEVIRRMEAARLAVEAERRSAQRLTRRLERMRVRLARKLRDAERAVATADREAEAEIERKVREVRDALMKALPALRSVPAGLKAHVDALERIAADAMALTPLGARRDAYARTLRVNQDVYVPVLGDVCRVVRVNRSKRRLTVRTAQLEAEIGFDDISPVKPEEKR